MVDIILKDSRYTTTYRRHAFQNAVAIKHFKIVTTAVGSLWWMCVGGDDVGCCGGGVAVAAAVVVGSHGGSYGGGDIHGPINKEGYLKEGRKEMQKGRLLEGRKEGRKDIGRKG
jgi:hypothetical protein